MKSGKSILLLILLSSVALFASAAEEKTVFGPVKYDVKERYGKLNRSTVTFAASDAVYLLKLQNGETLKERVDLIELTVNGVKVLRNAQYSHHYMAYFVKLKKENTFELILRDFTPPGFRRPPVGPKNATVTVLTAPAGTKPLSGIFGLNTWESLKDLDDAFLKISKPDAAALAMAAMSLQNDTAARSEALRKLADLKEPSARDFLLLAYRDHSSASEVRAEAALALGILGDTRDIPILMHGIVDSDEKISISSIRALSFYPEAETQDQLIANLEQIDNIRKGPIIRNIVGAGWKPIGAMIKMAESKDKHVAAVALGLLGSMNDPRATDFLLKLFDAPGANDLHLIIAGLGETKDPRVVDRLLAMASDPVKRKGYEVDLADALAKSGDQRAAAPIADMIKTTQSNAVRGRLNASYRKLTGKDY